jgi:hypothetical protein
LQHWKSPSLASSHGDPNTMHALKAEQKIAVDEQQVKQLQDSITANNQAIQSL